MEDIKSPDSWCEVHVRLIWTLLPDAYLDTSAWGFLEMAEAGKMS